MTVYSNIRILLVVILMSLGQVLFKLAARSLPADIKLDVRTAIDLTTNAWLVAAFVLYGLTTILWVSVLRDASLSRLSRHGFDDGPCSGNRNFVFW